MTENDFLYWCNTCKQFTGKYHRCEQWSHLFCIPCEALEAYNEPEIAKLRAGIKRQERETELRKRDREMLHDKYEKALDETVSLRGEVERKDKALSWIHNKIVAKAELYNYDEDLLRDIKVIANRALSTEEGMR